MQKIISCDWGTSTLRLRLVETDRQIVLAEVTCNQGIFDTYKLWQQQGYEEQRRLSFYQSVIQNEIKKLESQFKSPLQQVPIIISGMASSTIGMVELPYKQLPCSIDGNEFEIKILKADDEFPYEAVVISGVKTENDVMRGEETQLIGCDVDEGEHIFIFPGTHSKHVFINHKKILNLKTYMTGEFFTLLSTQSILSTAIANDHRSIAPSSFKSFEAGVVSSLQSSLLHNSFLVRTNQLFNTYTKEENYYYLSGLLIGAELKELQGADAKITIVGDELMMKLYNTALQQLGISKVKNINAVQAVIHGHCKIYKIAQTFR